MKIQKLFHYLYLFLMGLPILMLFGILLISVFNRSIDLSTISVDSYLSTSFSNLLENSIFSFACDTENVFYIPVLAFTSFFNVASDSWLNTLISYWANISIIWLIFDVMLYPTLLVHKWLDFGGVN